jgi:molybdopterin-guanine dinucleotide biosynthesis protein B
VIQYPLPVIGFCAFSGTGKTTLLTRLVPILKTEGLRIGVIKHAHHQFEIDHRNKDSYQLRKAGADQMLVASRRRMALVTEFPENHQEPTLKQALDALDPSALDLVLVEGFKRDCFPKIELHRPSLGTPLLCTEDHNIIAIATDTELSSTPHQLPVLDLNRADEIARFILNYGCQKTKDNPIATLCLRVTVQSPLLKSPPSPSGRRLHGWRR